LIVHPVNWDYVYKIPDLEEIESVMFNAVKETNCPNLFLSGGVDSSLALHFLSQCFPLVKCFTLAKTKNHPDYYYATMIASKYPTEHHVYIPSEREITDESQDGDFDGDVGVRLLSKFTLKHVDSVLVTDCIDELDCGYYPHQSELTDENYRKFLKELEKFHLKPLNRNTGNLKIYAPYASKNVIDTFMRIPLADKVNSLERKRHVMALGMKYLPEALVYRRKYGFSSCLKDIKGV